MSISTFGLYKKEVVTKSKTAPNTDKTCIYVLLEAKTFNNTILSSKRIKSLYFSPYLNSEG